MYSTLVRGIEALEILARAGGRGACGDRAPPQDVEIGYARSAGCLVRCGYANRMAGGIYSLGSRRGKSAGSCRIDPGSGRGAGDGQAGLRQ
jgi:hypothetical protein